MYTPVLRTGRRVQSGVTAQARRVRGTAHPRPVRELGWGASRSGAPHCPCRGGGGGRVQPPHIPVVGDQPTPYRWHRSRRPGCSARERSAGPGGRGLRVPRLEAARGPGVGPRLPRPGRPRRRPGRRRTARGRRRSGPVHAGRAGRPEAEPCRAGAAARGTPVQTTASQVPP